MGQYWRILNLDKRAGISIGKLGENLVGGNRWLVWMFAIPQEPAEEIGHWAGDHTICTGDYSCDYPQSLKDHPEVKLLAGDPDAQNLYHLASSYAQLPRRNNKYKPACSSSAFPTGAWILRNLTKRVYVRVACFKSRPDRRLGLPEDEVDLARSPACVFLGDLILSRISWSSDNFCNMQSDRLGRGVWAGDRLDIVLIASLDALTDKEEWKDISDEARQEIRSLWITEDKPDPFPPAAEDAMGQHWLLLNLDKRVRIKIGRLGDCLVGKGAGRFTWLFTVPLLPSDDADKGEPGCWAGDRIVCIGDYSNSKDYPDCMADHQDVKWLEKYGAMSDSTGIENLYQLAEYAYEDQCSVSAPTSNAFPAAA
ncbi:hypothetical protein PLICRDRAFT_231141 [Plicaturopsis crispa FD-325 SS-3]|nr:hypothetical protein PLICRDRAFT_231141 [Plicaturopsis crispa FD-325 SS-3]